MTDEIMHTVVPTASGGWGGTALGAGVFGLSLVFKQSQK